MRIEYVAVKNFRSLKAVEFSPSRFNVFVGQNNHGKSNLFKAIEWFYTGKGDVGEIRHCDAENEDVEVEIVFSGVQLGISEISNGDNQKKLSNVLGDSDTMKVKRSSASSKERWLWNPQVSEWKKQPCGADAAFNNCIPRFEFVGATQNFSDVSAYKTTTPIGQMLSGVVSEKLEKDASYQAFQNQFEQLFGNEDSQVRQSLDELSSKVSKYLKEQFPDCTDVKFTVQQPELDDFLKNYDTELNDGVVTKAGNKGDGMQRALMLAIIKAHADFRREEALGKSFIFFIDEAELHLHPSGQRQLKQSLVELTGANGVDQVFLSTHSSVLIADGDEDCNQAFFKIEKEDRCTSVEKVDQKNKAKVVYDLLGGNPADLLLPANFLIVEGESEVEFLEKIISRFYSDKPTLQVICGRGDDEAQRQTMNAINKVYQPLKQTPIYKDKLGILLDAPSGPEKQQRYEHFKRENSSLEYHGQLFELPVNGLEDYYPTTLKSQCSVANKVKMARWMGGRIDQNQFENEMVVLFSALQHCWQKAYQS